MGSTLPHRRAQQRGATSQIDVCLTGSTGTDVLLNYDNTVTSCTGPNTLGLDPYQVMLIANPAVGSMNTAQETVNIQIGLVNGTNRPAASSSPWRTTGRAAPSRISRRMARRFRDIRAPPARPLWEPPSTSTRRDASPRPRRSSLTPRRAVRRSCSTPRASGCRPGVAPEAGFRGAGWGQ